MPYVSTPWHTASFLPRSSRRMIQRTLRQGLWRFLEAEVRILESEVAKARVLQRLDGFGQCVCISFFFFITLEKSHCNLRGISIIHITWGKHQISPAFAALAGVKGSCSCFQLARTTRYFTSHANVLTYLQTNKQRNIQHIHTYMHTYIFC